MLHCVVSDSLRLRECLCTQLVTCIPTNCLPRQLALGAVTGHEIEMIERRATDVEPDDLSDDLGQRGQILWIRGITRLQHQVSYVFILIVIIF